MKHTSKSVSVAVYDRFLASRVVVLRSTACVLVVALPAACDAFSKRLVSAPPSSSPFLVIAITWASPNAILTGKSVQILSLVKHITRNHTSGLHSLTAREAQHYWQRHTIHIQSSRVNSNLSYTDLKHGPCGMRNEVDSSSWLPKLWCQILRINQSLPDPQVFTSLQ